MKKLVSVYIITASLGMYGCKEATFNVAQPESEKSLESLPKSYQGKYMAQDHASIVTISEKTILRKYDFDIKVQKDSLGTGYKLVGDTLTDLSDGTKELVAIIGDTITKHQNWTDTLFNISPVNILKKFKGFYFLNKQIAENVWEVKKMWLEKGILTFGSASNKEDIDKLKEITETTSDTTSTNFNLTKKQFKTFVKKKGFGDTETFTRMSENTK